MIPGYDALGATCAERNALFNSCTRVNIMRDCDQMGRTEWRVYTSTGVMDGGFQQAEFKTRRAAIKYALKRYPSLDIWAQWGDSESLIGNANRAVCDARSFNGKL